MWTDVLGEAGVVVTPIDADHVELTSTVGRARFVVRYLGHPTPPSKIPMAPGPRSLLVLPRISPSGLEAAEEAGWSIVTDDGLTAICFPRGRWVRHAPSLSKSLGMPRRRGPAPWGTLTVVRRLLQAAPVRQSELAASSSINQSRVSQILKTLITDALVQRTPAGWTPSDWDQLCDWWLANYCGPGGVVTYWYGLDAVTTQAVNAVRSQEAAGRAVVSGDVAADFMAPWRLPTRAVVYAEAAMDLTRAGWTMTNSSAATLELVNPKDPGVWPVNSLRELQAHASLPMADPLQVLWDLARSPGPDAADAAAHFRTDLRERFPGPKMSV